MQKIIVTIVDRKREEVVYSIVIEEQLDGNWLVDYGDGQFLFPYRLEALKFVEQKCVYFDLNSMMEAKLDYGD